jgi:hypothetical protein
MGADGQTLAGLAGLGDLVVTCANPLSRNRTLGLRLATGDGWAQIVAGAMSVGEGVPTTWAAVSRASRAGVELPIASVPSQSFDAALTASEGAAPLVDRTPGHEFNAGARQEPCASAGQCERKGGWSWTPSLVPMGEGSRESRRGERVEGAGTSRDWTTTMSPLPSARRSPSMPDERGHMVAKMKACAPSREDGLAGLRNATKISPPGA